MGAVGAVRAPNAGGRGIAAAIGTRGTHGSSSHRIAAGQRRVHAGRWGAHQGHVVGTSAQTALHHRHGLATCPWTGQARSHHRHANIFTQAVVIRCPVNHVGIFRSIGLDGGHGLARLRQLQAATGRRDQHQHAFGTRKVNAFQQRASHCLLGGNAGAIGAAGTGRAHHGLARLAHHGAHVFKVNVHMPVFIDDFSDTAHRIAQHIVGVGKRFFLGDIVPQDFQQFFVEHDDQGIDVGLQFRQALVGVFHAAVALPLEGLGHHTNSQNPHFLGHAGNDGGGPRARATAHTGGNKKHVRAINSGTNIFHRSLGRFAAFVGFAARAQAAQPQLDGAVGVAANQGLRIGVSTHELHTLDAVGDHVLNRVAATTTDPDHFNLSTLVKFFGVDHFDSRHAGTPGNLVNHALLVFYWKANSICHRANVSGKLQIAIPRSFPQ